MDWSLLSWLPEEEKRALIQGARRRRFAKGEVVFHEGDPGETMHLLVKGRVAVRLSTPLGDRALLRIIDTGGWFGELSVLSPDPRSATIMALEPCETLVVTSAQTDEIRRRIPEFDVMLVGALVEEVKRLSNALLDALYVPVEKRLYRRLVELARIYADDRRACDHPSHPGRDRGARRHHETDRQPPPPGGGGQGPATRPAGGHRHPRRHRDRTAGGLTWIGGDDERRGSRDRQSARGRRPQRRRHEGRGRSRTTNPTDEASLGPVDAQPGPRRTTGRGGPRLPPGATGARSRAQRLGRRPRAGHRAARSCGRRPERHRRVHPARGLRPAARAAPIDRCRVASSRSS